MTENINLIYLLTNCQVSCSWLHVLCLSFAVVYTISCASLLGRTGDKQVLSLQRYGCVSQGIIQHETLHALGFYHEHTRSDRDQYIKINWDNINPRRSRCRLWLIDSNWYNLILIDFIFFFLQPDFTFNFKKQDTNNLNTPYDYSSIMHYGR